MNKRQKKKQRKKETEKLADRLLAALGYELGESRATYFDSLIKEKGQV